MPDGVTCVSRSFTTSPDSYISRSTPPAKGEIDFQLASRKVRGGESGHVASRNLCAECVGGCLTIDHSLLGKIAVALSFLAFVPYVLATLRGKTRPNRATWIIWSAVGVTLLASYAVAGARETLEDAASLGKYLSKHFHSDSR